MVNRISSAGQYSGTNKTPLTPEQMKLKKACADFEAIMIRQMLEAMTSSTQWFGKGLGGDFFQSIFLDEIAKKVAEQELGLSRILYSQLEKSNNSK